MLQSYPDLHSASQSSGLRLSVNWSQVERGHSSGQPGSGRLRGVRGVVAGVVGVVLW